MLQNGFIVRIIRRPYLNYFGTPYNSDVRVDRIAPIAHLFDEAV